jgi:hypothetical protein
MRTVLRNTDEAAHVWAAQTQTEGKAGNVFFEGPTIYSYGRHFPMAKVYTHAETGERVALFNPKRYSVSTSKHQHAARHAWHGNGEAITAAVDLWPRDAWNEDARQWQPVPITQAQIDEIRAKQAELDAKNQEAEKEAKRAAARRKREQAKEAKAQAELMKISFPDRLAQWQAGQLDTHRMPEFTRYSGPIYLRYIDGGRRIETSRRAVVPTRAALALWTRYTQAEDIAGETVGPFTVNEAGPEIIRVGCHIFTAEILREFFSNPAPTNPEPEPEA